MSGSVVHVELPDRRKSSPEDRRIFIEQNPDLVAANGGEPAVCDTCPNRDKRIYVIGWKKIVWFGAPALLTILLGIIGWFENGWRVSVDADRSHLSTGQQSLDRRVLVLEQTLPMMQMELKRMNAQLETISTRQEMFYRWLYDDRQKIEGRGDGKGQAPPGLGGK